MVTTDGHRLAYVEKKGLARNGEGNYRHTYSAKTLPN